MSVHALALSTTHTFSKTPVPSLTLLAGLGVQGDCHSGILHLIPNEILAACDLAPGQIGENVTTVGIDLLALGKGTRLHFLPPAPSYNGNSTDGDGGDDTHEESEAVGRTDHPIVTIQGLRNPCPQIEKFRRGLQEMFIVRDSERRIVERKAGVMATVEVGGTVCVGMRVVVERAAVGGFVALGCV